MSDFEYKCSRCGKVAGWPIYDDDDPPGGVVCETCAKLEMKEW